MGDMSALSGARSWLFVPADRPERFDRAVGSGADVVIVDLEDAVAVENKEHGRRALVAALESGLRCVVRVSPLGTSAGARDLEVLVGARARPIGVMLAKCENADDAEHVAARLDVPVIALIESALGVESAVSIAQSSAVVQLALGPLDLALDLDAEVSETVLGPVRSRLVIASRAAGIAGPLDGPETEVRELGVVQERAIAARAAGMAGKLCIHPAQVPVVARAFEPSAEEIAFARRVMGVADSGGAHLIDGVMVDLPVVERARRVLARARGGAASVPRRGRVS
ncbi:HpcH/HpaI aldolase/citrate lyase family protein [Microbacterium immunditiarum]|uniref:Citrate lyase subunit beta/citryl-CoA lyase n=1 Tax=Microbacterium immunditiarum TaxID=337480 RepID=A0A7Y9GNG7_9MICO|nr:CoA ester lyase [Microbacterium immunditiarum]NYE19649.1 citrate lyase subunit beta/citryl-CoA lyase [Microbacterium immunditiarum]